jgi:tRNA(fMet)-specific endonuclease VapC
MAIVEILPVDRLVAAIFGEIIAELRRNGTPIPSNDIWIGATCACAGATLITWDAHFRSIHRIGSMILS